VNAGEELDGEMGGGRTLVASLARAVPTVTLDATVADAASAAGDAPFVLVVNDLGIVLGKILDRSLEAATDDPVEQVMIEGPTTVRAGESLPALAERMEKAGTASVIVTSNQGELIGVLFTDDAVEAAERVAAEHEHHHHER
jgi:CBS domain-containing protein